MECAMGDKQQYFMQLKPLKLLYRGQHNVQGAACDCIFTAHVCVCVYEHVGLASN